MKNKLQLIFEDLLITNKNLELPNSRNLWFFIFLKLLFDFKYFISAYLNF